MPNEVQLAYIKVWRFREETAAYYPLPDQENCLRFSYTEIGESLRAWRELNKSVAQDDKLTLAEIIQALTPKVDQVDLLRLSFDEMTIALDQWLRLNPAYKRNTPTTVTQDDLLDELCDVAFMLLSAIGPGESISEVNGIPKGVKIDTLCTWVSDAWGAYKLRGRHRREKYWITQCLGIVKGISEYEGIDLLPRLDARLARIKAKHQPVVESV